MFGAEGQVDPVRHLVGSALLWGSNPEEDALYLPITPGRNDGATVHELMVKDVPVDAEGPADKGPGDCLKSMTAVGGWELASRCPAGFLSFAGADVSSRAGSGADALPRCQRSSVNFASWRRMINGEQG